MSDDTQNGNGRTRLTIGWGKAVLQAQGRDIVMYVVLVGSILGAGYIMRQGLREVVLEQSGGRDRAVSTIVEIQTKQHQAIVDGMDRLVCILVVPPEKREGALLKWADPCMALIK